MGFPLSFFTSLCTHILLRHGKCDGPVLWSLTASNQIAASNKVMEALGCWKVLMPCLKDMLLNVLLLSISSQSGEIRHKSQQRGV